MVFGLSAAIRRGEQRLSQMRNSTLFSGIIICLLITSLSAAAKAPRAPKPYNNNSNNQNKNKQPPPPPPVDNTQTKADMKKLEDDRKALAKAQEEFNSVVNKLKSAFESSPDRQSAVAAARQAQTEYDTLRNGIMESVRNSAEYKGAVEARDQLSAKLAGDGGSVDDSDRVQVAAQRLDANKKVTKLETDAVSADPKAAAAQQKLAELGTKTSAQYTEFLQSIKPNADWVAARDALDKAKALVDADEKQLKTDQGKLPGGQVG
jgi:hypothetical protein